MSFHPGHDALHGFTVVVTSSGPETWVGRWHEERGGMIILVDAMVHRDGERGLTREDFLDELVRQGPRVTHASLAIPRDRVVAARPLGEVIRERRI